MIFFMAIFLFGFCLEAKSDPFSKISISSDRAQGAPDVHDKKAYRLTYQDSVKAEFADGSFVTADELAVCFDLHKTPTGGKGSQEESKALPLKQARFSGSVCVKRQGQHIVADRLEVVPQKRLCHLEGNVIIKQEKAGDKGFPVEMKSDKATLNLETGDVTFEGSPKKPVKTVLDLSSKPLFKKQKKKRREQDQATARARSA